MVRTKELRRTTWRPRRPARGRGARPGIHFATARRVSWLCSRRFFSPRTTQQVKSQRFVADWLAGLAMLLAMASWGLLASLLGA